MYLRGQIYEFEGHDKDAPEYALIVSNDERSTCNILSILITRQYHSGVGIAEFEIMGERYRVNCNMVTYAPRAKLGELVGRVDDDTMRVIDRKIMTGLGLSVYGTAYDIIRKNIKVEK